MEKENDSDGVKVVARQLPGVQGVDLYAYVYTSTT
jgi:hypothetical protein